MAYKDDLTARIARDLASRMYKTVTNQQIQDALMNATTEERQRLREAIGRQSNQAVGNVILGLMKKQFEFEATATATTSLTDDLLDLTELEAWIPKP